MSRKYITFSILCSYEYIQRFHRDDAAYGNGATLSDLSVAVIHTTFQTWQMKYWHMPVALKSKTMTTPLRYVFNILIYSIFWISIKSRQCDYVTYWWICVAQRFLCCWRSDRIDDGHLENVDLYMLWAHCLVSILHTMEDQKECRYNLYGHMRFVALLFCIEADRCLSFLRSLFKVV